MQLTQITVEQWATVPTVNPQLIATQMVVEQWATVAAAVSIGADQIRVMVMA